jgi:CRP-like cAMP-binding protein
MYLILDGELRARLPIGQGETTLATLGTGEFFGEIALFDHGMRSADVVANVDSTLLKIGVAAVQKLMQERPDTAAPFLWAIGKTLAARIRQDNKRHQTSFLMAKAARGQE